MTLTIELTPEEEAQLQQAAQQEGIDVREYAWQAVHDKIGKIYSFSKDGVQIFHVPLKQQGEDTTLPNPDTLVDMMHAEQAIAAAKALIEEHDGIAYIAGTGIKVLMIAEETALGRTPQQIQEAHPHLSLAQIHAALFYYDTHKEALDAEMERQTRYAEEMQAKTPPRFTREELQSRLERQRQSA